MKTLIKYAKALLGAYSIARTGGTRALMAAQELSWYAGQALNVYRKDVIYAMKDELIAFYRPPQKFVRVEYLCDHRRKYIARACPDCNDLGVYDTRFFHSYVLTADLHFYVHWLKPLNYKKYDAKTAELITLPRKRRVPTESYDTNVLVVWIYLKLNGATAVPLADVLDTFWDWRNRPCVIRSFLDKAPQRLVSGKKRCLECGLPYMRRGEYVDMTPGNCQCMEEVPF